MSYLLELKRETYTLKSTVGKLYLNGEFFCHTMEDVARGENIKIDKQTAIPTGMYDVDVTLSQRFQREMPMVYTEKNGYEIKKTGVSFKGVRLHGGNTADNSEGCILVAKNRLNDDLIQGTMEKELTDKLIALGRKGKLQVVNK